MVVLAFSAPAHAELDLSRAGVSHLDNGLTVIILEDHSLPVVSTQVLYKSGARDETAGKTGLAHFLEHLAFRATEHFAQGEATGAIYDAGGEWHGYTWIDETTFYATMPSDSLDLLLRIEADRMARVEIDPEAIEAEKGAVLTEMHGYENDPSSLLFDAAVATALQAHPYRNNTIGYESDVRALTTEDAQAYYDAHYAPGNAVLAIVGDVEPDEALAEVREAFGALPARPVAPRTNAVEPPQRGERRVTVEGPVTRQFVKLVYPAPAASSADFPAFLLLQQLLSGGSGINFGQNDWGTPAVAGSAFHGAADDLTSWFIPTRDPYVFMVSASIGGDADRSELEDTLARRIETLRSAPVSADQLAAARAAVGDQLVADVETTEDAAHQLAYFEGIGAYDTLIGLEQRLDAVTPADIERIARTYLDPARRTVAWLVPGTGGDRAALGGGDSQPAQALAPTPPATGPASAPEMIPLDVGLPAIIRRSPLSPTVTVELLTSGPVAGESGAGKLPGIGAIVRSGPVDRIAELAASAREALDAAAPPPRAAPSEDPATRLEQIIEREINAGVVRNPEPLLAVLSGDVDPATARSALGEAFGDLAPAPLPAAEPFRSEQPRGVRPARRVETIHRPLSQAALGYVVAAPQPGTREGLVWRILLYVLSHDYAGRLGDEAISARGLVYYIGSDYRTDGAHGWATLSIGVDPDKIDATEAVLREQLARLASDPPSAAETEAGRQHLLGRDLSAAQSNDEIAAKLAREYVETGGVRSHDALAAMLADIAPKDLTGAAEAFANGTIIRVDVESAEGDRP